MLVKAAFLALFAQSILPKRVIVFSRRGSFADLYQIFPVPGV